MINFSSPELLHRLKNYRSEHIVKALGKKRSGLRILDATAGLGRDALILAAAGNNVLGLEQNADVHALLAQELEKLHKSHILNIVFEHCNSIDFLKSTTEQFDIIYLDPMFPKSSKSRLVKQEMVWLKNIVGENNNPENNKDTTSDSATDLELFNLALQKTGDRVIIKRPIHAPFINGIKPNYQILGDINRFDVYK